MPRRAIHKHSARPALPLAATVFASGQAQFLAQRIKERRIGVSLEGIILAINFQLDRHTYLPCSSSCRLSFKICGRFLAYTLFFALAFEER